MYGFFLGAGVWPTEVWWQRVGEQSYIGSPLVNKKCLSLKTALIVGAKPHNFET